MSQSNRLLEVKNLNVTLQSGKTTTKAVDDVSFHIQRSETFCLVGESGSGKSITALSVIQLLPQSALLELSGRIELADAASDNTIDLLQQDTEQLYNIRGYRIAMIFQDPMSSLNPVLPIGEQIIEALQLHHPEMSDEAAKQKAIKALQDVQIRDAEQRFSSFPHQLSGGQRQRVMIAMALACEPDLLIADEPTTALDVTVQAEILKLMQALQNDYGMSMLFITHDFGVVAQMAHRVGVMQYGKLVEVGETENILRNPQHAYTQQLIAALPHNLAKPEFSSATPSSLESEEALCEVTNLNVWFPIKKGLFRHTVDHVKAVDEVSLRIKKGKIVALVGESGSGKTTLGRAILQLQKSTAGSIKIDGQELTHLNNSQLRPWRRRMQIAFQDPQSSLNPRLPIATTLTEPMQAHRIGEDQDERIAMAESVLEQVQLDRAFLWRYPHEFSGGQRQRIGLARALVLAPEFIVCDEITSALDVSVQAEILQLLLEIRQQRNLTLLFITHNIGVVEYLSDETVVMYRGKVIESGLTEQVCNHPQQTYTQELLNAVPRF